MELVKIPTNVKKFNFNFTPEWELRGNQLREFIFAGNALFTTQNEETGNHITYLVKKHKEKDVWVVATLTGNSYKYIGVCFEDKVFKPKVDGELSVSDRKVVTFGWILDTFLKNQKNYEQVKFYHHGRCGRCHKTLTTPESIKSGIGPVCGGRKKMI